MTRKCSMLDFGPFAMTRAEYGVTRKCPMLDFELPKKPVTRKCPMLDFWPGVMPRCSESRAFNGNERSGEQICIGDSKITSDTEVSDA